MAQLHKDQMRIASLEVTMASLQSTLSDYALRARQAEELVALHSQNWDMESISQTVIRHVDQRAEERAVHQQSLIQATILALTTALKGDEQELRQLVNTVVQELTKATMNMHELITKQQELQRRSHDGTASGN